MKRILLTLLCSIIFISFAEAQCKAKSIVKVCKKDLAPFNYDSYAVNEINFTADKQIMEVEFATFAGNEYRLVFCTSECPHPLGITIYDKPKTNKKRKPLYFDESSKDGFLCNFTPEKSGTYYIEYSIPGIKVGEQNSGCVVMLIGIK
jgi:hypothetical protein